MPSIKCAYYLRNIIEIRLRWIWSVVEVSTEIMLILAGNLCLKGTAHPKIIIVIIYSPFTSSKLARVSFFFCWAQNKLLWWIFVTKQLMVAIDLHCTFSILWKLMAAVNCLVTDILQISDIFVFSHSYRLGTSGVWVNDDRHLMVSYLFKGRLHYTFVPLGSSDISNASPRQ